MHKSNAIIFMCSCCCLYCNCIFAWFWAAVRRVTRALTHTNTHTQACKAKYTPAHTHTRERAHTVRDENESGRR